MKSMGFLDRHRDTGDEAVEKRRQVRFAVRRWVLVGGAAILLLAVGYDVWATYQNRQDTQLLVAYAENQSRQEARLVVLTAEVKATISEHSTTLAVVENLEKQVASVIDGLPAADHYLGELATGLEGQIQSLCNKVGASCSALSLPSGSSHAPSTATAPSTSRAATPSSPAPFTTTTTAPGHGHRNPKGHG